MKIREIREKLGFSRHEISEMLGINEETFARYERGESEPRAPQMKEIAGIFGVTIDELLNESNEKKVRVDLLITAINMRTDGLNVVVSANIEAEMAEVLSSAMAIIGNSKIQN